ncbi:MAG: BMP family ABC transporter substrate-binding protein [Pseudolysinimonas sp.]
MNLTTRKRALAGIVLAGASAVVLAGCGAAPEANPSNSASSFLACAVSDEGSFKDHSFNEAAYGGLTKAHDELGVEVKGAESHSTEDFNPNLQAMVDANCNVIFGVGFNLIDPINAAALANPTFNFVTIDGYVTGDAKNLKPIQYSMEQSSYLAGYLSAGYSTTKVLGTYGGLDIPAVTAFMQGYYQGAQAWATDHGKPVTVLGMDASGKATSFTDPVSNFGDTEGAKAISAGFLAAGADVIFPVAGGLFASTAEAITESGSTTAVFLGVDKDIAVTSPQYKDMVLTSVEKRMTQAVFDVIKQSSTTGFDVSAYQGTLENDGTGLSDFGAFDSKISADLKAKITSLEADIISGKIKVTVG